MQFPAIQASGTHILNIMDRNKEGVPPLERKLSSGSATDGVLKYYQKPKYKVQSMFFIIPLKLSILSYFYGVILF